MNERIRSVLLENSQRIYFTESDIEVAELLFNIFKRGELFEARDTAQRMAYGYKTTDDTKHVKAHWQRVHRVIDSLYQVVGRDWVQPYNRRKMK